MAVTCYIMLCASLVVVMVAVSSLALPLTGFDDDKMITDVRVGDIAHISGKCTTAPYNISCFSA